MNTYLKQQFEKLIALEQQKIVEFLHKLIEPILIEGEKAYEEFVSAEKQLEDEKFSRN
jgi:hypothetical protein